jgi:hypothetical protein
MGVPRGQCKDTGFSGRANAAWQASIMYAIGGIQCPVTLITVENMPL